MTDYKQLCAKVLAYYEGQDEYDFSHLGAIARDNAAFDAWQELRAELKTALAKPEPESELRNNTLSPAAYAIIAAAYQQGHTNRRGLAAALRTAAQHLCHDWSAFNCIDALCEIADELEGRP